MSDAESSPLDPEFFPEVTVERTALGPTRALRKKLPAFYQENLGLLEPLLGVAEELLADVHAACRERNRSGSRNFGRHGLRSPAEATWETLFVPDATNGGLGTFATIRSYFEQHGAGFSPPLEVWSGRTVFEVDREVLEVRRRRSRCAVLVWREEDLPSGTEDFELPERFLPVGVDVQAVRIRRLKYRGVPPDRARIPGILFWQRGVL